MESYKTASVRQSKTAITDFLRLYTEENLNESIFLNKLIKSFKSEAPRPKNGFPNSDLAMILNFLNQPICEPLSEAELKFLTWKMVFLVTMVLAAKSSEVHALSFAELEFEENYTLLIIHCTRVLTQNQQITSFHENSCFRPIGQGPGWG